MKNYFLKYLTLSVLFAGGMQASTVTWDFSLGTTGSRTSPQSIVGDFGGFTIVAKGFANTNTLTNLWRKNDPLDEKGLGLENYSDHEIVVGTDFIQLDLSALGNNFTNFKIMMNSTTPSRVCDEDEEDCHTVNEGWKVYNCATSGTACSGSGPLVASGTDEGTYHTFNLVSTVTNNPYLDIKATSGNVLLYKLQADTISNTTSVPEPSTGMLLLLSGGLIAGSRRLRIFKR